MEFDIQNSQIVSIKDEKTFESLFRAHYNSLAFFALRYVKDEDIAEEIVQEMFSNFWIKSDSIHVQTSVKSYLFGAVRNACLNYLKHQKIKQSYADNVKMMINKGDDTDTLELDELKEIVKTDNTEAIKTKLEEVKKVSQELGIKMYEQSAKEQAEKNDAEPKVVDAEVVNDSG